MENFIDKLIFNKITHKIFWCFWVFVTYTDITKNPAPELRKCPVCWKEKITYTK